MDVSINDPPYEGEAHQGAAHLLWIHSKAAERKRYRAKGDFLCAHHGRG